MNINGIKIGEIGLVKPSNVWANYIIGKIVKICGRQVVIADQISNQNKTVDVDSVKFEIAL